MTMKATSKQHGDGFPATGTLLPLSPVGSTLALGTKDAGEKINKKFHIASTRVECR